MPISTKRLYLRPFTPDDAPSIYQYAKILKLTHCWLARPYQRR